MTFFYFLHYFIVFKPGHLFGFKELRVHGVLLIVNWEIRLTTKQNMYLSHVNVNGVAHSSPNTICNLFNDYFVNMVDKEELPILNGSEIDFNSTLSSSPQEPCLPKFVTLL